MIHIWHEDDLDSSTTQFWRFLKKHKLCRKLADAEIKGFGGNNKLLDELEAYVFDKDDTYYIFLDLVIDNSYVTSYIHRLNVVCKSNSNVIKVNNLCFEYLILSFIDFVKWTQPFKVNKGYKECERVRKQFIHCINNNIPWVLNKDIVDFIVKTYNIDLTTDEGEDRLNRITSEQIATLILSKMTNTGELGFQVSKTILGPCWTCDCKNNCERSITSKYKDVYRHCYLNKLPIQKTSESKAYDLWTGTEAHNMLK